MQESESKHLTIPPKKEHKHTIIWIHGLTETAQQHCKFFQSEIFDNIKIILPQAPKTFVTVGKSEYTSWYDIKFRNEKSFLVPFDEAFSSAQVHENFKKILKPLIIDARSEVNKLQNKGLLIIGGFSQGCGMALHSFYEQPQAISAVIGISGYLFPFSKFNEKDQRKLRILYGQCDKLRPWEFVKVAYEGKLSEKQGHIVMVPETDHEVNTKMQEKMCQFIRELTL